MKVTLVSLLAIVALTWMDSTKAAPIAVVENGRARAVIVVPSEKPSPAVFDLRDYVEKATGARLDVIEEHRLSSAVWTGSRIFVGPCAATRRVVHLAQLQPEGFVIKSDGNDLFIVGRDTTDG